MAVGNGKDIYGGGGCGIKEGRRLRTIARGWKMHGKRLLLNISGLRA